MKTLIFTLIFLICTLIPTNAEAPSSRELSNSIVITPTIEYQLVEESPYWDEVITSLAQIQDELEGYVVLEALHLSPEQDYEDVTFKLLRPLTTEDEPIVIFIEPEIITVEEIGFDEDGNPHLNLYKGDYFICFCIRGE